MSYNDDVEVRLSLNNMGFRTPGRSRMRRGVVFTPMELKELGIAVGVLTIAFAFAFSSNGIFYGIDLLAFLLAIPIAFIAVGTGFGLHEIAHKIVANHYGYPAAFSYSKRGLIFALVLSVLVGWLIAAPGAVFIYGYPSRKENGVISLAGPLTNLIIGLVAIGIAIPGIIIDLPFLTAIFMMVALINFILGAFNMIPIMPLDGAKIWKWNKFVYIVMALILVPLVLAGILLSG